VTARGSRRTIRAAIDIGSYSVHLLVARLRSRGIEAIHDESAFLGLGRTIDREGRLASALPELTATIAAFKIAALARDAVTVTVVGTDPLRRALDSRAARAQIEAATGLAVETLSHQEEAIVALLGVMEGRAIVRTMAMVDLGGGSTEVLVAEPGREPRAIGLALGATRVTGHHVHHDPPLREEFEAMADVAWGAMRGAPVARPAELVAVGGTARSLLRCGPPLRNRVLTRRRIHASLALLEELPALRIAERYSIRPSRAAVLPAGATILDAALEHYDLDHLRVARGGLREGLILATARAGDAWRAGLLELARGWEP
jgi:exopolyphosphatase/pppGpp-phosphohydrolase